ncbi:MAG: hypothetical protein KAV44_09785 [Bacteroidales bacterium]|nr:hypothetical protein [Bacteroidales bacterium]
MRKLIEYIIRVIEKVPLFKSLIRRFLFEYSFRKNKQEIISLHNENINNGRLIRISIKDKKIKNRLINIFKISFGFIIKLQGLEIYSKPAAIILLPETIDDYLKFIGPKSRNMIRKAGKSGYVTKSFIWNENLEDIFLIHTSSKIRQGRQMDKNYRQYPRPFDSIDTEDFKIKHIGVFHNDRVVAYIELSVYGNFAMTRRILGKKEDLKFGVMNLLFKEVINYGITERAFKILNYLTMENYKTNNLSAFKYRVGFREFTIQQF